MNVLWCQGPLVDTSMCTYIRTKHAVAIQPVSELSNGWFYWRGQLTFSPTPLKETSDHYCQPQLSTLNGYWAVWWDLWACMSVKVILERNAYNISKRESVFVLYGFKNNLQICFYFHVCIKQTASVFHQESDRCTNIMALYMCVGISTI